MKKKGVSARHTEIFYVTDERISKIVGVFLMPKLMKNFGMSAGKPIGYSYTSFDLAPQATKAMQSNPDIIAVASVGGRRKTCPWSGRRRVPDRRASRHRPRAGSPAECRRQSWDPSPG